METCTLLYNLQTKGGRREAGSDSRAINRITILHVSVEQSQNATAGYCPLRTSDFNSNKQTNTNAWENKKKPCMLPSGALWQAWSTKPSLWWGALILMCAAWQKSDVLGITSEEEKTCFYCNKSSQTRLGVWWYNRGFSARNLHSTRTDSSMLFTLSGCCLLICFTEPLSLMTVNTWSEAVRSQQEAAQQFALKPSLLIQCKKNCFSFLNKQNWPIFLFRKVPSF